MVEDFKLIYCLFFVLNLNGPEFDLNLNRILLLLFLSVEFNVIKI